ncbi:MAG TPA: GNAT family N-acetyltransferase [Steroidobacteraceae bacterium]|jgi:ribosomal-protein-alanine N-acetyltransferase|nr:GNAT family N-acetyltransferase [Steroidobacteraceae bacterium]
MPADAPILTPRLLLRPPTARDAAMIFRRYAADTEVTRLVGWPRHEHISDTDAFLNFSAAEWARWPAGPLLIESRSDGRLLGSTGLAFETPIQASTGYVLARDSWGFGYASEALRAVVQLAEGLAVTRLYALCHPSNLASIRVLERCDFACEGLLPMRQMFPNLGGEPQDVASYALLHKPLEAI